jgi:hypothetical protein
MAPNVLKAGGSGPGRTRERIYAAAWDVSLSARPMAFVPLAPNVFLEKCFLEK